MFIRTQRNLCWTWFGPWPWVQCLGWAVLLAVLAFYGWLVHATFRANVDTGEFAHGEVHV